MPATWAHRAAVCLVLGLAVSMLSPPPAVAQRINNPIAEFTGLDKITGRIIKFDVLIDETVQFGALQVTPRARFQDPAHLHRLDVCRQPRSQRGGAQRL